MTESELRKTVVSIVTKWLGGKQGSSIHKEIMKIWNDYAKKHGLPQAQLSYAWCAETASAAMIKAGIAEYVPISLSCGQLIAQAKKLGIWVEDDAHKPKIGEEVIYGWDAPKTGDAAGTYYHDHVGIVVSVGKDTFSVIEGNAGTPSQVRKLQRGVDWQYISGFITPSYKAIAKNLTPATPKEEKKEEAKPVAEKLTLDQLAKKVINGDYGSGAVRKSKLNSLYKQKEIAYSYDQIQARVNEIIEAQKYKKTYKVVAKAGLNIRTVPQSGSVLGAMPYRSKCTCDGRYKKVGGVIWLHVTYGKITGWSSSEFLE